MSLVPSCLSWKGRFAWLGLVVSVLLADMQVTQAQRLSSQFGQRAEQEEEPEEVEEQEPARTTARPAARASTAQSGAIRVIVERFRGTGVIVRFIEYMDVGNRNEWRPDLVVPSSELAARIGARWPLVPIDRNYPGEVAERQSFADGAGEVGFISSVSQPFCGGCSRARLSSDGTLYNCLFATAGVDLRAPMRAGADDDALTDLLRRVWAQRSDRYSEQRAAQRADRDPKVEMFHVGG